MFFIVVIVVSMALSVYAVFCMNDILAITKTKSTVTVSMQEEVKSASDAIVLLADQGLFKCNGFCKFFATLHDKVLNDPIGGPYPAGVYYLNGKMGLEGMLQTLQGSSATSETVTLIFPEGMTVPEIVNKLTENDVCDKTALLSVIDSTEFTYSMVADLKANEHVPYRLEGYMFPDTYEFLKDDTVHHYVATFYAHFDKQITDAMYKQLDEQGMTLPELITLASFVQEEAGTDQDDNVAQVFRNRLSEGSPYPKLQSNASSHVQSDADNNYLWNWVAPYYGGWDSIPANIRDAYDTYNCSGLPAGPISNPGLAAIRAALDPLCDPEVKDCYFFVTDQSGHYYYAKTFAEHQKNCAEADSENKSLK